MTSNVVYHNPEQEVIDFFKKSTTTRSACDARAKELAGGDVTLVDLQGVCSYTVYAGPDHGTVVQFRLKSLALDVETVALARKIYGDLVPEVVFKGQIGEEGCDGKEPLYVYVMDRVKGLSVLGFILKNKAVGDSPENFAWRKTLMTDIARFFATTWKHPQTVDQSYVDAMRSSFTKDLEVLLHFLPERFRPIIQQSLDALPAIFSLPMVLLHRDLGESAVFIDPATSHLVGVIDWAEATVGPFGLNLHFIEDYASHFHLKNGFERFGDYDVLQETFWSVFREEVGGLDKEILKTIQSARIVGLLLSRGFTSRLANMPEPVPIQGESGAYNMLILDGLLIDPATRFVDGSRA